MSSLRERRLARERQLDQDCARADYVVHLVAMATGVPTDVITGASRTAAAARARQMAMYLTHAGCGLTLGRVGAAFGRDRATVAYAVERVEGWREAADVDALLGGLEAALRSAPAGRFP
jgi:chromosomal replication initiation ATPase DnaA